jgi:hypothetical protein
MVRRLSSLRQWGRSSCRHQGSASRILAAEKVPRRQAAGDVQTSSSSGTAGQCPDESQTPKHGCRGLDKRFAAVWNSVWPGRARGVAAGSGRAEERKLHGNLHMPPDCCGRSSGCGRDVRSFWRSLAALGHASSACSRFLVLALRGQDRSDRTKREWNARVAPPPL